MKTGEPIAAVSADDPGGFALGLGDKILGPLGAQWLYEGESLGYRTLYVWFAGADQLAATRWHRQAPRRRRCPLRDRQAMSLGRQRIVHCGNWGTVASG